jgi:hypothetical protein
MLYLLHSYIEYHFGLDPNCTNVCDLMNQIFDEGAGLKSGHISKALSSILSLGASLSNSGSGKAVCGHALARP